jgi:hypothetical protein
VVGCLMAPTEPAPVLAGPALINITA